ncbi:MAG: glycosyltransferase family 9 protein, partial [Candidatus Omnitrophica bacterium]|nr:glycosyltransferase family 9 protein [Candidatus Omnitrophota bacterium]
GSRLQFPLGPPSPGWWRHWGIIRTLRRERFDLAFNFSGADRTLFLTALTGAKWRLAHQAGRRHFWNRWLIADWVPRQDPGLPVFEQRRQVLAAAGLTLQPARFDLRIPNTELEWADRVVPSNLVHLSINASTPVKEWPLERWIDLGRVILRDQPALNLVASGSSRARERERLSRFEAAIQNPRLTILPGNLTIARLSAVLSKSRVHVGGDSGVIHLAMALGVPTLSLFRQYEGTREWLPRGPGHRHLTAPVLASISTDRVAKELGRQFE